MLNQNIPNIPGMGAMTDTLEFVKNLWGGMGIPGTNIPGMNMPGMQGMSIPGMNIPGMVMPTLSVEEIRKKVSDLKAVESWLELNMNMLRGTIQALEVQAATIATLQSMGDALNATMQAGANMATAAQEKTPQPESKTAAPEPQASSASQPTGKDQADAATLTAPLANAAAWWNLLQDQFKNAVSTAMTQPDAPLHNGSDTASPEGKAEPESPAPSRKRKPAK